MIVYIDIILNVLIIVYDYFIYYNVYIIFFKVMSFTLEVVIFHFIFVIVILKSHVLFWDRL